MTRLDSFSALRVCPILLLALPSLLAAQPAPPSPPDALVGAPTPAVDLAPAAAFYRGTLEAGGQSLAIAVARTIQEDAGSWVITDTATLPMGEVVDRTVVEKGSLIVRKRSIRQGPSSAEIAFAGGRASGSLSRGEQSRVIDAETGGEVFADGSCMHVSLAALPLAEGYSATFRNFDVQRQRPTLRQVKVLGVEDVTVPAGTFKAWRAEVSSVQGEPGVTTLWIDTVSRRVVKTRTQTPAMGGATITTELQP